MKRHGLVLACVAVLAGSVASAPRASSAVSMRAVKVSSITNPVAFATRTGEPGSVFVAQKTGVIRKLRKTTAGATLDPKVVLNISDRISSRSERGLVGIAFGPAGYKLYAAWSNKVGDLVIAEYPFANGVANKAKQRIVLTIDRSGEHHVGGQITFGPDKLLYITTGDSGVAGDPDATAQNLGLLLGKMLRINPNKTSTAAYSVPASNPFVGTPGARPEIWHYGLRNSWKWSFDRANGDQWIGDVGQNEWEEVDYVPAGGKGYNFGWNLREGSHPYEGGVAPPGAVEPLFDFPHDPDCSVTGGYVYRGTAIAELAGKYVFTDYCNGVLRTYDGGITPLGVTIEAPVAFGEDAAGELWVLSMTQGVYRLLPGP